MNADNKKLHRRVGAWSMAITAFMLTWGWVASTEADKSLKKETAIEAEAALPMPPKRTQVIVRRQVAAANRTQAAPTAGGTSASRRSTTSSASRTSAGASQTTRNRPATTSRGS